MAKGSMREQMPTVAALIDELRAAFGKDSIDGQVRKGMNGQPMFWASENGHTVGTKAKRVTMIKRDARGISYEVEAKTTGSGE